MSHQTNSLGFSIIEMVISLALTAFLLTASLMIYNQITKTGTIMQKITSADIQAMIINQRMSLDLEGLTPLWFTPDLYKKTKTSTQSNNFLFAQSYNNQFDLLTFVTTNALQTYAQDARRIARVTYWLKESSSESGTFVLLRAENPIISNEFNIETLKQQTFYELAKDITTCTIQYGYLKKTETGQQLTFVSEWGKKQTDEKSSKTEETNQETEKNQEEEIPNIPNVLKIIFHIATSPTQEKKYELMCPIPTSQATAQKAFVSLRKKDSSNTQSTEKPIEQSTEQSNEKTNEQPSEKNKQTADTISTTNNAEKQNEQPKILGPVTILSTETKGSHEAA